MYAALLTFLDTPQFSPFIQHFGYLGIYIWFITFDQLTPFPEEISLLIIDGFFIMEEICGYATKYIKGSPQSKGNKSK